MPNDEPQGGVYSAFVEAWLKAERERRTAQEARATAVLTSSGAFVTLILALNALLIGKDRTFVSGAKWLIIGALVIFATSGIAALMAGQLMMYKVPHADALEETLGAHWTDSEASARLASAWLNLDSLISLRSGNNRKSWWLDWALRLQLGAVFVLACGAVWEVYRRVGQ